jgi:hypothetical protein
LNLEGIMIDNVVALYLSGASVIVAPVAGRRPFDFNLTPFGGLSIATVGLAAPPGPEAPARPRDG